MRPTMLLVLVLTAVGCAAEAPATSEVTSDLTYSFYSPRLAIVARIGGQRQTADELRALFHPEARLVTSVGGPHDGPGTVEHGPQIRRESLEVELLARTCRARTVDGHRGAEHIMSGFASYSVALDRGADVSSFWHCWLARLPARCSVNVSRVALLVAETALRADLG